LQQCSVHTLKKMIAAGFAATLIGAVLIPGAAQATGDKPIAWSDCANLKAWDVNHPDEDNRRPTPTVDGLKFEGSQLIHHPADLKLKYLKPGSFVAAPKPDQDSFFSVEIRDATTDAYATLRWNKVTAKWDASINGQSYSKDKPSDFVGVVTKWGTITDNARVVSFGVGYTATPPGSVPTTVSSVTFAGKTYPLTCKPEPSTSQSSSHSASPSASASASASASHSASPSASVSSSHTSGVGAAGDNGSSGGLPVTGAAAGGIAGGAAVLLAAGGVLFVMARRRKVKFTA
jgi:hypothetical protein